jgi:hypothetical protein
MLPNRQHWFRLLWGSALALGFALTGCGYVGDTKPPTLDIPTRVTDLRAAEYGANIAVEFTIPALTTEGLELKNLRSVDLRITGDGQDRTYPIPAKGPGPVSHDVPAQDWIGKQATITVRATGPKGKTSDWSNAITIAVGAPLGTPRNVSAKSAPEGVLLTWAGPGPGYRIFRAVGDGMPERLAESAASPYTDTSAAFGTKYRFIVQSLDSESRQSELSAAVEITPQDEFPPAVPNSVSAVAGVDSIELSWERNTEDDFAGYNVYRSVGDSTFERLASAIESPVYSDRMVDMGKRYRYVVTAVDANGNESARSAAADATAQ